MTSLGSRVGGLMDSISDGGAMVFREGSAKVHVSRSRVGTEGRGARESSGYNKVIIKVKVSWLT